jgi:hypothetical protein
LGPPAGNGTISRIGFAGNSCAAANAGDSSRDNPANNVLAILIDAPGADFQGDLSRLNPWLAKSTGRTALWKVEMRSRRGSTGGFNRTTVRA